MNTSRHQRGLTLMGLIMSSALIFIVALMAMKLFPLYNELFKVRSAMKSAASQPGVGSKSETEIRSLLMRSFEVQDVETFTDTTVKQLANVEKDKKSGTRYIHIKYEKRGNMMGNLDVVLRIDERTDLPK